MKIKGNIDFRIITNEDELDGKFSKWKEIAIHGDPEGLLSFANLLIEIANINQDNIDENELPTGERKHIYLNPSIDISKSSSPIIIGRLDAKGTREFYECYTPKE